MSYNVRDKISYLQKSRIENQNIDGRKFIRNEPLEYNRKRSSLTNICSFIQKLRCKFKYTPVSKNDLDMKPIMNDLISLYGNMNEHKISEAISSTEAIDVGKMIDFDILQEDLVDIDMLFNELMSKIDRTTNSPQIEKPDINLDDLLKSFDSEHGDNTSTTITSTDSSMPQSNDNNTTIFSDHDFDFDRQLIADFSVLSKLITIMSPPPRSNERPIITDAEYAKKFYYGKIIFKNFINKLKLDFANVIILDDRSKPCFDGGNLNNSWNYPNKKKVNVSSDISFHKTFTDNEYDRSDSNGAYTLHGLKNPKYAQPLKSEINEFKQKEMTVYEDSILFIYFI